MNKSIINQVKSKYQELYGSPPQLVVKAPGRINLIGEHTDYNDGYVLPGAIDKYIYIAIGKAVGVSAIHALDLNDDISFDVFTPRRSEKGWPNYILGVVSHLQAANVTIGNFQAVFAGDIPQGSGLSSSAALECGFGYSLCNLFGGKLSREDIARIGQKAEHDFVGVQCGIMDQFASVLGKKDHVFLLDCRNLLYEYQNVVLEGYEFILINSKVHHELASSEYNHRRADCEKGVEILSKVYKKITHLRDIELGDLLHFQDHLSKKVFNRCKYVIEESSRVLALKKALAANETEKVGELMFKTHQGLSKLYEVSCQEIDYLVELAKKTEAIVGARMMGGGFGGCTINLIESGKIEDTLPDLLITYEQKYQLKPEVIRIKLVDGVLRVD